jgi:peptide/nickel transport system permease protein
VRHRSARARAWRRFRRNRAALVGLAFVAALALLALFPDQLAPYPPNATDVALRGSGPSAQHPLGMDQIGRDVASRVIHGARLALLVGCTAAGLALATAVAVGAAAGYRGGWADALAMRAVDALMAFPPLVLLVVLAAAVGPSVPTVILVIGLTTWAQGARIVRVQVLGLRERDFVLAARALGASPARVLGRHVLPNVLAPVVVLASLSVATVILLESALSFPGLGVPPPTPDWGSMLTEGRTYLLSYPHIALFPGLAIMFTALAFNLVGDGLRDALDPRA